MRRLTLVSVLVTTVFVPASARAATTPSAASPPVTTPAAPEAPAPPPAAPLQTHLALQFDRVGGVLATALTGAPVVVRGTTDAFAPDQTVVVRFYVSGRKLAARRVSLLPQAGGGGGFALSFTSPRPGALVVLATHDATPALAGFATRTHSVDVIPRRVTPRSGRSSIRALQRRLRELGYVTGAPGVYDERTGRAVLAFRKVAGLDRNANASANVMHAIARGAGRFVVAHPEQGRHVEADLSRQVLALIEQGRAVAIYPISSGKPSTPTVLGSYRVYTKTPGTNEKGMVDSSYFFRGYAIHGYFSVPTYAASHGCLRIPVPDAATVFNWVTVGTPVDVYR
ncbi:MAG TPA: L,D-transpeptidase family protein [Solirubrobacteraceae bacterium]|jgi:lipoprotein-anchoring transpeptidase ErfK/SrfK|nr:L,D-transpeptidase family protein [Solirubrobacteraceae bacterium]